MNRNRKYLLALCLLVTGAAGANDEPAKPVMVLPDGAVVPNVPPELAPLLKNVVPASAPASLDAPVESAGLDASVDVNDAQLQALPDEVASSAPPIRLGKPAQHAVVESQRSAENPAAMPMRDTGGRVLFPFGQSVPTVVCAPLRICDIELQRGETVRGTPHIGDAVRWKLAPAVSGLGEQQVTHLIVKPTEAGLDTNLIVPTDYRTYHIRLVSSAEDYVSSIAFDYPEEQQRPWEDLMKAGSRDAGSRTDADMPTVAVNRLNFNYKINVVKGKPSFKPLRAMDDGYHTYIAMNEEVPQREAPVLIGISPNGEEQMINYRLKGNLYVVDGTIFKLALISGVGRTQQRIELTRAACRNRGWLGICWDAKE